MPHYCYVEVKLWVASFNWDRKLKKDNEWKEITVGAACRSRLENSNEKVIGRKHDMLVQPRREKE
jgi:hypothetical protein